MDSGAQCIREEHPDDFHVDSVGRKWVGGHAALTIQSPEGLARIEAGTDPRAIVADVFRAPFAFGMTYTAEQLGPLVSRIRKGPTEKIEVDVANLPGLGVANRVTAEQLLAIIATIIATAPNATAAITRIKQEVEGWRFE